jgi:hypothetical protein
MSGSRDTHRKEIGNRSSSGEPSTSSQESNAQRLQDTNLRARSLGQSRKRLVSHDSQEQDSEAWHVSDDWPEFVPITVEEVEVIEAFLRNALDELLKDK